MHQTNQACNTVLRTSTKISRIFRNFSAFRAYLNFGFFDVEPKVEPPKTSSIPLTKQNPNQPAVALGTIGILPASR